MKQAFDHLAFFEQVTPVTLVVLLLLLAVLPFLVLSVTSFVKINVVFSILRNALGAQQIPSTAVVTLMSLVLTFHIMAPVAGSVVAPLRKEFLANAEKRTGESTVSAKSLDAQRVVQVVRASLAPLEQFLRRHSAERERRFFASIVSERRASLRREGAGSDVIEGDSIKEDFTTLVPAFLITELHEAFAIGVSIFLPFLIIDLLVSHLLVALGMLMVSPVSITLPMKLILFVVCDGWFLLCRSLLLQYA